MGEEKEEKVLMIGGNDPSVTKTVMETLNEKAKGFKVFELEVDEMKYISDMRLKRSEGDTLKDYLQNEETKNRAKQIAFEFYTRWKEIFDKDLFVSTSEIKKMTKFSWKEFNRVIATLDMFGHVEWQGEDKKNLRILVDEDYMLVNKKNQIQDHMDVVKGLLLELRENYTAKKDVDKINTMIKRMTVTV